MKTIACLSGGIVRHVGLAAAALLMTVGLQSRPADAVSLASPGATPLAQHAAGTLTTEVRGGPGGGGMHMGGGGGGMHMGGGGMHFGGGGPRFGGGGFHTFHGGGPVFHGGGMHYGGIHYGGMRYGRFGWRHFHHRRFFVGGGFYPYYYGDYYPYYYGYNRCRIIWTHFGPRRICHWPHWYRWHRWHHWHHRWHHRHYW